MGRREVSTSTGGTSSCRDSNSFTNSGGYRSPLVEMNCPTLMNVGPSSTSCSFVHRPSAALSGVVAFFQRNFVANFHVLNFLRVGTLKFIFVAVTCISLVYADKFSHHLITQDGSWKIDPFERIQVQQGCREGHRGCEKEQPQMASGVSSPRTHPQTPGGLRHAWHLPGHVQWERAGCPGASREGFLQSNLPSDLSVSDRAPVNRW